MPVRGRYYTWYTKRINKKYTLGRTFLEPGMLVEVNYKPEKGSAKNYICLLLHKGYGSLIPKKKMHLLSLEHLPPKIFNSLVEQVGLELSDYFEKVRKIKLGKFLMEQKDTKKFYITELKNDLDVKYKDTYRTFTVENVNLIKVLDFNFDKL